MKGRTRIRRVKGATLEQNAARILDFEVKLPLADLLRLFPEHSFSNCSDEKTDNFNSCPRCGILEKRTRRTEVRLILIAKR